MMENKLEKDLHHLESMSTYQDWVPNSAQHMAQEKSVPSIPDGISTPKYDEPSFKVKNSSVIISDQLKPSIYDGTTDPRVWLNDYNFTAEANSWDESKKFNQLIGCLSEAPLLYFRNERIRNPAFNWKQFCEGLVRKFSNSCDGLLSQLRIQNRFQKPDESFNLYWESKLNLIEMLCPEMSNDSKIMHLFYGLNDSLFSKTFKKFKQNPPKSLDELYSMVKIQSDAIDINPNVYRREAFGEQASVVQRERSKSPQPELPPKRDWNKFAKTVDNLAETIAKLNLYDRTQRREVKFVDGQQGVKRMQSGVLKRDESGFHGPKDYSNYKCYKCSEFGHISPQCTKGEQDNAEPGDTDE